MKRVVIIGMGFGGLRAARALAGKGVEVLVIDRRNFHLFQRLYGIADPGPGEINRLLTQFAGEPTITSRTPSSLRNW